ncbi:hypothetical protein EDC04DRAFT_2717185 [Pisolithus marmoratus]|nr:hypothetical protein EDC04DRAFT_2717185 [Pisolithus marmoratus]
MQYSVAAFDTAPTGHNFPFLSQTSMMGCQQNSQGGMFASIVINEVTTQFQDPDHATFVCSAVPDFLSLCETERLV